MSFNNEAIPLYRQRAIQALLRAGMRSDSILDAIAALKSEGEGLLHDLRAIENVPRDMLSSWIQAIALGLSETDCVTSGFSEGQENQPMTRMPVIDQVVRPSALKHSFIDASTMSFSSRSPPLAHGDECNPTAAIEYYPISLSTVSRSRKTTQFMARHCIGSNGKCASKSKSVWKYQSPWESHFREKHLSDFPETEIGTYACFCSTEDCGNASEFMQHIWDTHMVNYTNTQSANLEL